MEHDTNEFNYNARRSRTPDGCQFTKGYLLRLHFPFICSFIPCLLQYKFCFQIVEFVIYQCWKCQENDKYHSMIVEIKDVMRE